MAGTLHGLNARWYLADIPSVYRPSPFRFQQVHCATSTTKSNLCTGLWQALTSLRILVLYWLCHLETNKPFTPWGDECIKTLFFSEADSLLQQMEAPRRWPIFVPTRAWKLSLACLLFIRGHSQGFLCSLLRQDATFPSLTSEFHLPFFWTS